jgi:hypothetical protein
MHKGLIVSWLVAGLVAAAITASAAEAAPAAPLGTARGGARGGGNQHRHRQLAAEDEPIAFGRWVREGTSAADIIARV